MDAAKLVIRNISEEGAAARAVAVDKTPFTIGRNSNVSLFFPWSDISRNHAEITESDGVFFLKDHQSTNGTFLNRVRLQNDPEKLSDGDLIRFGRNVECVFFYPGKTEISEDPLYEYGIEIDPLHGNVYVDGKKIDPALDKRCFAFLRLLAQNPGKVYTYQEIAEALYPGEPFDELNSKKLIYYSKNDMSKKLRQSGITRDLIRSRSGVGYQLITVEESLNS